jgi:hypothetical protein
MQCVKCCGDDVWPYQEGDEHKIPSMACHQCQAIGCGHIWFTCNAECRKKNGGGRRNFNTSYPSLKSAKRHHTQCHSKLPTISCDIASPSCFAVLNRSTDQDAFLSNRQSLGSPPPLSSVVDQINFMNSPEMYPAFVDNNDDSSSLYSAPLPPALILDEESYLDFPSLGDGELLVNANDTDLFYHNSQSPPGDAMQFPPTSSLLISPAQRFKNHMISGEAVLAASVVVSQALFQTPHLSHSPLPVANVMLFLYLAKLVISTGELQQGNLSKVLQILYPYAEKCESTWAPMPSTVSGFTSRISNVTNSNSLVSILPIPCPETLPDGHGYTPFRQILNHALMMKRFEALETQDPKWHSLAMSLQFRTFLQHISDITDGTSALQQIAVGIIVWTDGWDTSTGTKSNRSPMHTGTITLLFVDVASAQVVGIATYPNMGGPGKIDHGTVFRKFQDDIAAFETEGSGKVFQSCHFAADVEIHTKIMFIVQDQPERRAASGLLGGGSSLHPLFGTSCDFKKLQLPFVACTDCEARLHQYLRAGDWTQPPMAWGCLQCLGWSLDRLYLASYQLSCKVPNHLDGHTPGAHLFTGPGKLTSSLLIDGWNFCIDMFAVQHKWIEADVKKYLGQLCINDATITTFVDSCRRHVFLRDVHDNPDEYTHHEVAETILDANVNPTTYELPQPPAMWLLSKTEEKPEGIMHLSMGIQKAVFKFIIRWASDHKLGSALQRRLADGLKSLQELNLSYCPCRPYKDDKFGGYNAETYRGMTMVSTQLYRCLNETGLAPPPPRGPNQKPQDKWLREDNMNWMFLRGVVHSLKITAPEARQQVSTLLNQPSPPPIINGPKEPITTIEMRDLVFRMQNMFRAIFCTDLCEGEAGNRSTASVMRFLCHLEVLDLKLNPKRDKPIWIVKYNFLGLLRICETFPLFRHARNLYEGGVIGEGIVKVLRPLTAAGMHGKWATNLLLKHYRQVTLDMLIAATEGRGIRRKVCPLGEEVESSKFRRYTTIADVTHLMNMGKPLSVMLYGSAQGWKAGVIVVSRNRWYFKEVDLGNGIGVIDDVYGLAYHSVTLVAGDTCLGIVNEPFTKLVGDQEYPFWDYGLLLPDLVRPQMDDRNDYKYGIVRSNWQYLDRKFEWNEFD